MIDAPVLREKARALGFAACGVARCRPMAEQEPRLRRWIDSGRHAGMEYMNRNRCVRLDPARLAEGCRSVVVTLTAYPPVAPIKGRPHPVAAYAQQPDYHGAIKPRLYQLLDALRENHPEARGRACVDSAPILEKAWAVEAGLGWIGRNRLLINPDSGSYHWIGILLTDLEFSAYDTSYAKDGCGNCRRCLDACPTAALSAEDGLDARRCISYHTLSNRRLIPNEVVEKSEGRLIGCDACQVVCPHNARRLAEAPAADPAFDLTSEEWLTLDETGFFDRFGHTPLAEKGLEKIRQTVSQQLEIFQKE
ncbi:MAG: tRNA epoxyqueuosine(34) reductase QueG [Rikenellaceae bacterium]|jgi:epoxyqueuosine reductase|nr:tRNA epoxyqueuosine(34) reductase QueG [Rikenellaceae bacterium]